MQVSIIVAAAENNVIGKDNKLLWRLPKDMQYFKNTTWEHCIIMGRKTFESLGKPLPNRKHIIITHQKNYSINHENCFVVDSLEKALDQAQAFQEREVFIIGGGEIYKQALEKKLVDKIYLTKIKYKFEGDTYFPDLNLEKWKEKSKQCFPKDEKNGYDFEIVVLEKII